MVQERDQARQERDQLKTTFTKGNAAAASIG